MMIWKFRTILLCFVTSILIAIETVRAQSSYGWLLLNSTNLAGVKAKVVRTVQNDVGETILATETALYKAPFGSLRFELLATLAQPLRSFEFYKSPTVLQPMLMYVYLSVVHTAR